jgi:hypothetical protein
MPSIIFTKQLAQVGRSLRDLGVSASDPLFKQKFDNAWAIVLGGSVVQRASQITVDLPSLEDNVQADIVKDNVLAVSALYFAAQLEELKFFAVADKVAEQFETGIIPMSRGVGGDSIYQYMRAAPQRFTEAERRGLYARAFGFAQGSVDEPMPNREFADLFIRFLSAVSVYTREENATIRQTLTREQVFKNARDLAVNVSLHGYGIAHFAAVELQDTIKTVIKMMSYPDVLAAYGVNDIWQLVERVSGLYLGGSVNSVRQRTLATAGSEIIQWLAKKQTQLVSTRATSINFFHEHQLTQNVERWLAVTGTDDTATDKFSEPVSVPQQPTIPNLSLQQALPQSLQSIVPQVTNGLQGAFAQMPSLGNIPAKA